MKSLTTYICIYLICISISAQELQTEILTTSDGLSNNRVLEIFQDSYSLLWIGTENGLNLYDGYKFKIYKNDPDDPESINSNVIWWINEDAENNLWISTGEGVSKYIRRDDKFKNYDFFGDYYSSVANYIDSKGNIWVTIETEHILKYDKINDSWEEQKFILDSSRVYSSPAHVTSIVEDNTGILWIASIRFGLMWYDEKEKVFRQADIHYDKDQYDFTNRNDMLIDLYLDDSGVLWITSMKGIYKYYPKNKKLKTIQRYVDDKMPDDNDYNSIIEDRDGNIWITNNYNGFLKFDGITDNYSRINITGQVYDIYGKSNIGLIEGLWDNSGILWIGTSIDGLVKYNPNKLTFSNYSNFKKDNKNVNNEIFSLFESKVNPNKLYVGIRRNGLNLFDLETENFSEIPIDFINDIYGGAIRSINEEGDGSLWLGSWGDGLLKMDQNRNVVKRYIPDFENYQSISGDRVRVIRKDSSGNLWIGTSDGLNYFDIKTKKFNRLSRAYSNYPDELLDIIKSQINDNKEISKIVQVGDNENLSVEFEADDKGKYLIVAAGEGNDNSYPSMWDYGWIEDEKKDTIWSSSNFDSTYHIGGADKNRILIDVLEISSGKYTLRYISDDSHCYGNWNAPPPIEPEFWGIRVIKINKEEELDLITDHLNNLKDKLVINGSNISDIEINNDVAWIGTRLKGLFKVDLNKNIVKNFIPDIYKNPDNQMISVINDIYIGDKEYLWIATNKGLSKFFPSEEIYINYTEEDGLPSNIISSILPGDNGELWLSTNNGISKMIYEELERPIFVNYGLEDGIGGSGFTPLVALKTKNEKYFFGGRHGITEFEARESRSEPPSLILKDFKISNLSILKTEQNSILKSSIIDLDSLSLKHNQNDLSFEFSALHFSDPRKNKYAHKLEGYEDEWIYDNNRIVTYTNLDPGNYIFIFKGSNNDGIWNEVGKSIYITIAPPWWKTWWAYSSYTILIFGFLYSIRRVDVNRRLEKENKRILEIENERKTKELDEARQLQLSMLPKELPKLPNLDIAVYMKTATEVGGDYYDFNVGMDGTLTVVIGDATGHGMKAGTMVTSTKSLFATHAGNVDILYTFHEMTRCFKTMHLNNLSMCITMCKIKDDGINMSSAGMPPVYIYRKKTKSVEEIIFEGMPLGTMNKFPYKVINSKLSSGDTILLLSDGLPELMNNNNELFNYNRVKNIFNSIAEISPEDIIVNLKEEVSKWIEDKDPEDDITFVVIKIK